MGYNAVYSVKSQPTFQKKTSPPSSGSKKKPRKKPARNQMSIRALFATCFHADFLLGLFFDPED
jgi:hypothetical protein